MQYEKPEITLHPYRVALWPTRLAASPVETIPVKASSPRVAAIIAMKHYGVEAMGVVVVMGESEQYSFFDAAWHNGELYFGKEAHYPHVRPGDNPGDFTADV